MWCLPVCVCSIKKLKLAILQNCSIKTSIPFIMHTADLFAARFENERWIKEMQPQKSTRNITNGRPKKSDLGNAFTNGGFGTVNVFDAFKDVIED